MAHLYCPDKYEVRVRRYIRKLVRCGDNQKVTKEEREKEKEAKRNKEKEEKNSLSTREALSNLSLNNKQNENASVIPEPEVVQRYLNEIGETRFTGVRFVSWYRGRKSGTEITNWKSVVDGWRENERRSAAPKKEQKKPNEPQPKVYHDDGRYQEISY